MITAQDVRKVSEMVARLEELARKGGVRMTKREARQIARELCQALQWLVKDRIQMWEVAVGLAEQNAETKARQEAILGDVKKMIEIENSILAKLAPTELRAEMLRQTYSAVMEAIPGELTKEKLVELRGRLEAAMEAVCRARGGRMLSLADAVRARAALGGTVVALIAAILAMLNAAAAYLGLAEPAAALASMRVAVKVLTQELPSMEQLIQLLVG